MLNHSKILAGLALAGLCALTSSPNGALALQQTANVIRAIDVADADGAVEVAIRGSRAPSYTVFRLQGPSRLVVDVAGGDVSRIASPIRVDRAGVEAVTTAQYQDERTSVGRIVIALDGATRYEVTPHDDSVVVKLSPGPAAPATASAAPAAPQVAEAAPAPAPKAEAGAAAATADAKPVPETAPAVSEKGNEDHVVSRRRDESSPSSPATALTGGEVKDGAVVLRTNGPVGTFEVIELRDPPRLAIDLYGVQKAPRQPLPGGAGFTQIRFGKSPDKVRVVLDASSAPTGCEVRRLSRGLSVRLGPSPAVAVRKARQEARPEAKAPPAPETAAAPRAPAKAAIRNVRASQAGKVARIEISGKAPFAVSRPDPHTLVLVLDGAELPRRQERSLDTSALSGPLLMVSAFNQAESGQVRVVASLRGEASDRVVETDKGLIWTVTAGAAERHAAEDAPVLAPE
ncbi:MAG TPA: AMIN domain-containing protein, partial [Anaeromyxobacteraceae bacterium]|nr:AMIN domain-containing protein [Anaeromyxobacteraceae bacterium]